MRGGSITEKKTLRVDAPPGISFREKKTQPSKTPQAAGFQRLFVSERVERIRLRRLIQKFAQASCILAQKRRREVFDGNWLASRHDSFLNASK